MPGFHYDEIPELHPQNFLLDVTVATRYLPGIPEAILPDRVLDLSKHEYVDKDTLQTLGLQVRRDGDEAVITNNEYDRITVRTVPHAVKHQILKHDLQLVVDVRADAVETLSTSLNIHKSQQKAEYMDNYGATKNAAVDTESNAYTGTGTAASFLGKFIKLSASRKWDNTSTGTPITDILNASKAVTKDSRTMAEWLIMSTDAKVALFDRPDIQNLLAENSEMATSTGLTFRRLLDLNVAVADVIQKDEDGDEVFFNEEKAVITSGGSDIGYNAVSQGSSISIIDMMALKNCMQVQLEYENIPVVQRTKAIYTVEDLL